MSARTWRPDGPGSFQAPEGIHAVRDNRGRLWTRNTTRWTCTGSHWIRWRVLVADHGPVTEATDHPAQRATSRTPATSGRTQ
ncbi:hypothetical protein F3K40_15405 [Streptomyces sp. LBUM 1478]|uniref:hypothetical protein n=1 Tax=Streptomyces scabiei TaxID=1930 RepID=UPI000765AD7D|nr:hypothetical protein [Streptomyces scabiei]MBP5906844.1 hypothetical protein [Streptomyces sp. LBUM 1478]MBP5930429.1 hypothetical protein [Streptomyces sp. LBUM 1479]